MDWIIQRFVAEAAVIGAAPMTFTLAAIVIGWLIYLFLRSQFATRLDNAASTIALREAQLDDYKQKLSGATPDEAKARIDALETQVNRLAPRRLGAEGVAALSRAVTGAGGKIEIARDGSCSDGPILTRDLVQAFQAAGWKVQQPTVLGIGTPPQTGLALKVSDPMALTRAEAAVVSGLRSANIAFDIHREPRPDHPDWPDAILIVAADLR